MKSNLFFFLHLLVCIVIVVSLYVSPVATMPILGALIVETVVLLYFAFQSPYGSLLHSKGEARMIELIEEQDRSSKLLIRRDIELTAANEKLRELDMQKSEFIAIIAHQMRTPLSAMKWTLNMLLKTELGVLSVDQQSFIEKAEENNNYMIALVEDMLFADKLESGKSELNRSSVAINDIIESAIQDVMPKAATKKVVIEFSGCNRLTCTAFIDKEKIRSVIENVIDNAVAYTPESGTVIIHAESEGEYVVVTVRDSGIGIPESEQPYIFSKFYRAPNAKRLEANGSGLGLFIARRIMEAHQGSIAFDSVEGKGTTFTMKIPKK